MKYTLKLLRQSKNLTQGQVADMLGIDRKTWSNYEHSKTFPDVPVITKIETLFKVNCNDIIFLQNNYGLNVNHERDVG